MKKELLIKILTMGIFVLVIGISIIPVVESLSIEKRVSPDGIMSLISMNIDGYTLYVGGDGPGNYTTIQAAINAANPDDTIFVYDDSSPYHENVVVNKMIKLIGEDKNTTIINGLNPTYTVFIDPDVDNVLISGFTITGSHTGIEVCSDNNIIQENKIFFNTYGIEIDIDADYNIINNNIIVHNFFVGIFDGGRESGSNITWNVIGGNGDERQDYGGLYVFHSGGYYHHNDFYLNRNDNAFVNGPWGSTWDDGSEGNYWDDWQRNPGYPDVYIIPGSWEDGIDRHPSPTPYVNYPIVSIYPYHYSEVNTSIHFFPDINVDPSSVSWFWEFGDGGTSNEMEPSHSYTKPGTFHINVTVTDDQGNSDTDKCEAFIGLPPNTPIINGSTTGKHGVLYEYSIVATDPDGGNLYYDVYWGDGNDYVGPYPAGEIVRLNHSWYTRGAYTIRVYAVDEAGFESDWAALNVVIPRTYSFNSLFLKFLERVPHALPILRYLLK